MTKTFFKTIACCAILGLVVGCQPPASDDGVSIDVGDDTTAETSDDTESDNTTGSTDNITGSTDNVTGSSETPLGETP